MKLIFCLSNLFVPATISLIKENKDTNLVLYTDQIGINEFFNKLNFDNVKLYFNSNVTLSKNPRKTLNFFLRRSQVLSELEQWSFSEIYFFHNAFGDFENYIISKLSLNSKVYHCPVIKTLPFNERVSIKSIFWRSFIKLIHNTEVLPLWTGERYIYKLSDSFLRKINAKRMQIVINNKYINNVVNERLNLDNNLNIVLLTGTIVELGQVERKEYELKIDALINAIGKENIVTKPHPRYPGRFSLEKELKLIPSYIPANVLFTKFNVYIGYSTTVLTEAANEGYIAISLLDYLIPSSIERKERYKDYLTENLENGEIQFPRDIEEIITIITNSNNKL